MANYDVFISHKSEDKQYLTQIEQFLDEKNYTYWSDSKMEQGITWTDQIHKAIKDSNVVIVLLSANVIADKYNVEKEILCAVESRLPFIVVNLDDSSCDDLGGTFDLYLKQTQWINAKGNVSNIFDVLDKAIKIVLSKSKAERQILNQEMEVKMKDLERIQKEEYDRKLHESVMEGLLALNINKVEALLDKRDFIKANEELKSLLLASKNNIRLNTLNMRCATKDYTCFDSAYTSAYDDFLASKPTQSQIDEVNALINNGIARNKELAAEEKRKIIEKEKEEKLLEKKALTETIQKNIEYKTAIQKNKEIFIALRIFGAVASLFLAVLFSFPTLGIKFPAFTLFLCYLAFILFGSIKGGFFKFLIGIGGIVLTFFIYPQILSSSVVESSPLGSAANNIVANLPLNSLVSTIKLRLVDIQRIGVFTIITLIVLLGFVIIDHVIMRKPRNKGTKVKASFYIIAPLKILLRTIIYTLIFMIAEYLIYKYGIENKFYKPGYSFSIVYMILLLSSYNLKAWRAQHESIENRKKNLEIIENNKRKLAEKVGDLK